MEEILEKTNEKNNDIEVLVDKDSNVVNNDEKNEKLVQVAEVTIPKKCAESVEIESEKINTVKLNVNDELEKINFQTIWEYQKTLDYIELNKIKAYTIKDHEKTVCLLFYNGDFFAINRINYRDGFEYDSNKLSVVISENLNYRIKKIPNVAKTRKILRLEDIETRIYDVSDYVILLKKEDVSVLRVTAMGDVEPIGFSEISIDCDKLDETIKEYQEIEDEIIREERSIVNKFKRIKDKAISIWAQFKRKIIRTTQVKMLSDGKHSIFDKAE